MDFGASDIVRGIELALTIYQYGFVEENAADYRYRNFQEDIFNFRRLLQRLNQSLRRAQRRYLDRGPNLGLEPYDPLESDFEDERKAIVGDFLETLNQCDSLLKENQRYRAEAGQRSGPLLNLQWNLTQQEQRVDDLRRRLHFHTEKIRFVIDRLQLDLLTDLDATANDLVGLAEQNLDVSDDILFELNRFRQDLFGYFAGQGSLDNRHPDRTHVASADIATRFQSNLQIDAPTGTSDGIPLAQGFDALLLHFQQSARGSDQTPEKYLSFLKARWLLGCLKASPDYRRARPGLYFKRAVNQLDRAILTKARRQADIVAYEEAVLLDLPETFFRIWPEPKTSAISRRKQPDQLTPRANEIQVAHIELDSHYEGSTAFVNIFKSSESHYRLVHETQQSDQRIIVSQQIDTCTDRLIPRYALPSVASPQPEIAIWSRNEEFLYQFKSTNELYEFQTAFTGYQISYDHGRPNIRCQFSDEVSFLDCEGRIQLWQDPITMPTSMGGEISRASRFTASTTSGSGGRHSQHGSLISTTAPTTIVIYAQDGWQASRPKMAAVVIFTEIKVKGASRFMTIFLELEDHVKILPKECSCHENYNKCSKLVLGRLDKRKMALTASSSETNGQGQPNPNTFDIFPFRLPRGERFNELSSKRTEYLVLKFKTLQEKQQFHHELDVRFRIRDKQLQEQRDFFSDFQRRGNQPQRLHSNNTQRPERASTSPNSASFSISPPRVSLLDSGPTLAEAIEANRNQSSNSTSLSTSPRTPSSTHTQRTSVTSIGGPSSDTGAELDRQVSSHSSRSISRPTSLITSALRRHTTSSRP
ncbi:hypothetical protein KC351_g8701 [Hortaea werneckii]|nr:hypothetical protein KC351_g8701 [Hortaea werneckii]